MKVLFDTNIVLDVLLKRMPHVLASAPAMAHVETSAITGVICAHTVTTVFYFLEKSLGKAEARNHIAQLLAIFDVAAVNRAVLTAALALDFGDYEDAVVHEAAVAVDADAIVTRNGTDFVSSIVPIFTPGELLAAVAVL